MPNPPNPPKPPLENQLAAAEIKALQQEVESLKKELGAALAESPGALREVAARAQADLQNAKDRLEREARDARRFAAAEVIQVLLPVLDHFQRAFDHLPPELLDNDWVRGVKSVEQELSRTLGAAGLKKISALGERVDTQKHEVLQSGPGGKDKVTEVFEDGYELHGKILRPAKVKVGDGSSVLGNESV
ncbi:MAG TPA: nucleotide exchange factor GrpE [Candidatus Peribacteraceae bacterium]|nr:nucleotide exchange factor GrpE [Candidatus Peribacteraceae bacterium]